jgi:hypothetical protein
LALALAEELCSEAGSQLALFMHRLPLVLEVNDLVLRVFFAGPCFGEEAVQVVASRGRKFIFNAPDFIQDGVHARGLPLWISFNHTFRLIVLPASK